MTTFPAARNTSKRSISITGSGHWEKHPLFIRFDEEKVRAVFSTRYRPIDHLDIAARMGEVFPEDREVEFSLSDELMLIRAIDHQRGFKIDGANGR